jgi:hypothetical protein
MNCVELDPAVVCENNENWDEGLQEGIEVRLMIVVDKFSGVWGRQLVRKKLHSYEKIAVKENQDKKRNICHIF